MHLNSSIANTELLRLDNTGLRSTSFINYSDGAYNNAGLQFKKESAVGQFKFSNLNGDLMTISSNGYIGTGTIYPTSRLHIAHSTGEGNAPTLPGNIATFQTNANSGYYASINIISGSSGKASFYFGDKNTGDVGGVRYNNADNSIGFRTNGVDDRMIITTNGDVGIGTTTPNQKLTIQGHVNIGGTGNYHLKTRHIDGKDLDSAGIDNLYLNYGNGKDVWIGSLYNGSTPSDLIVSGNIGVGTSSPDSKLRVKGDIHTNEVKVDLLGAVAPDYVFHKNYDLKALQEVENYISNNGHLPNIPSAKDMENEGNKLKEMNLKLLEKIEALTLYTIQQEKRINTLEKENATLKGQDKRISLLEDKIESLLHPKP